MGRRGPKPTPTPLLKLRGSWRGESRAGEIVPEVQTPMAPTWLRKKAVRYWPDIAEMLAGLGLMTREYSVALALLVDALADWVMWAGECDKPKSSFNEWTNKAKAWERVLKACREFGLTPSAITSVKSVKQDAPDEGLSSIKLA
jgi:phage terminase small subunit